MILVGVMIFDNILLNTLSDCHLLEAKTGLLGEMDSHILREEGRGGEGGGLCGAGAVLTPQRDDLVKLTEPDSLHSHTAF